MQYICSFLFKVYRPCCIIWTRAPSLKRLHIWAVWYKHAKITRKHSNMFCNLSLHLNAQYPRDFCLITRECITSYLFFYFFHALSYQMLTKVNNFKFVCVCVLRNISLRHILMSMSKSMFLCDCSPNCIGIHVIVWPSLSQEKQI